MQELAKDTRKLLLPSLLGLVITRHELSNLLVLLLQVW